MGWDDEGLVDRNNFAGGGNAYCVKDRIITNADQQYPVFPPMIFNFNTQGEIARIDLNRWYLSDAG